MQQCSIVQTHENLKVKLKNKQEADWSSVTVPVMRKSIYTHQHNQLVILILNFIQISEANLVKVRGCFYFLDYFSLKS